MPAGRSLPAHVRDVAADVCGRLGVGSAQRGLHVGHEVAGPRRQVVVDGRQELEAGREADVGDRRKIATDEASPVEEERAVDVERAGERGLGRLLRLRLGGVVSVRGRPPRPRTGGS